jgi:hypothetical protein
LLSARNLIYQISNVYIHKSTIYQSEFKNQCGSSTLNSARNAIACDTSTPPTVNGVTPNIRYNGASQPTRDRLIELRGVNGHYRYNAIQRWQVAAGGAISNAG